jgi:hypothetical protein
MAFGLWPLIVKGREAEFLVSCNLIGGNRRLLGLRPQREAALVSKRTRNKVDGS